MGIVGEGRRRSRGLLAGISLLALLGAMASLAPLIASRRPLLARGPAGFVSPAWRAWVGDDSTGRSDGRPILAAPIPFDPADVDLGAILLAPSRSHLMGTDAVGRDLAARIVHGGRVSLAVGLLAAALALLVGVPLGAAAGYFRGPTDWLVSRVIEAVLCVPSLLLALALLTSAPRWLDELPDALRLAVVLSATGWTPVARYLRAEFLRLAASDMMIAARSSGAGHLRIVARHLLPSALAPVLVTAAFAVAAAILLEAALSFFGLGVRPPVPTWGGLLGEAKRSVEVGWWLVVFPGACLFLAVLACNLVGEGVRDLLDPRSRA